MFLKAIILVHKAGSTLEEVEAMEAMDQLEDECANFCNSDNCPKLVREEYEESQLELETENEDDTDGPLDNPGSNEEPLHIEPEYVEERLSQDDAMMALLPMVQQEDYELIAGEGNYDDAEFLNQEGVKQNCISF